MSTVAQAQIARVLDTKGTALVERSGQVPRLLGAGERLDERDVINVARDSWTILEFNDQTRITLRPNTVFRLDSYRADAPEAMLLGLVKGGLRVVTGLLGKRNPSGVKVHTAVATIGIRGTEFDARLCEADCAAEERARPAPRALLLPVARVVEMNGVTAAARFGEAGRVLVPGAGLYEGDGIATGPGGYAVLVFRDGARVTLAANSRFAINRFQFNESAPSTGSAYLTLLAGDAHVWTGRLAKISPDAFLVESALGIVRPHGTGFSISGCIGNACGSVSGSVDSGGASGSASGSAGGSSASASGSAGSSGASGTASGSTGSTSGSVSGTAGSGGGSVSGTLVTSTGSAAASAGTGGTSMSTSTTKPLPGGVSVSVAGSTGPSGVSGSATTPVGTTAVNASAGGVTSTGTGPAGSTTTSVGPGGVTVNQSGAGGSTNVSVGSGGVSGSTSKPLPGGQGVSVSGSAGSGGVSGNTTTPMGTTTVSGGGVTNTGSGPLGSTTTSVGPGGVTVNQSGAGGSTNVSVGSGGVSGSTSKPLPGGQGVSVSVSAGSGGVSGTSTSPGGATTAMAGAGGATVSSSGQLGSTTASAGSGGVSASTSRTLPGGPGSSGLSGGGTLGVSRDGTLSAGGSVTGSAGGQSTTVGGSGSQSVPTSPLQVSVNQDGASVNYGSGIAGQVGSDGASATYQTKDFQGPGGLGFSAGGTAGVSRDGTVSAGGSVTGSAGGQSATVSGSGSNESAVPRLTVSEVVAEAERWAPYGPKQIAEEAKAWAPYGTEPAEAKKGAEKMAEVAKAWAPYGTEPAEAKKGAEKMVEVAKAWAPYGTEPAEAKQGAEKMVEVTNAWAPYIVVAVVEEVLSDGNPKQEQPRGGNEPGKSGASPTLSVWDGEVEVVGRGRVGKGGAVKAEGSISPVAGMTNIPRPDSVKVDPDLFKDTDKVVEEGLYVWVRDGAVSVSKDDKIVDVPAGNAAVATKNKVVLLDVVPNFLRFDQTPRPFPALGDSKVDVFRAGDGSLLNMCSIR